MGFLCQKLFSNLLLGVCGGDMPGMGEFVAADTQPSLVNVCSKDFPIWHVLSATPPPPSLDKSALRKGQRGRPMFHSMQGMRGQAPGHCRAARSPIIWSPATGMCRGVGGWTVRGPVHMAALGPQLARRGAAALPIACLWYGGKWLAAVSGCLTWLPCRPPKRRLIPSDQSPAAPQNI